MALVRLLRDGDESFVHELRRAAQHRLVVGLIEDAVGAEDLGLEGVARRVEQRLDVGLLEGGALLGQLRLQLGQVALDGATLAR